MKYKTAELEGGLLDLAVAKAEGLQMHPGPGRYIVAEPIDQVWAHEINPSRNWRDGGPIVARERIVIWPSGAEWRARAPMDGMGGYYDPDIGTVDVRDDDGFGGATPLIAAMRAYVAKKLGDEVELP